MSAIANVTLLSLAVIPAMLLSRNPVILALSWLLKILLSSLSITCRALMCGCFCDSPLALPCGLYQIVLDLEAHSRIHTQLITSKASLRIWILKVCSRSFNAVKPEVCDFKFGYVFGSHTFMMTY